MSNTYLEIRLSEKGTDILQELENKGYLLSTERDKEYVKIIPFGVDLFDEMDDLSFRICFERDSH